MADSYLLIDYVYLDSEERKRFAQASHEYLIEQLQFTGSESLTAASNKYRLNFNHPCKYLIWVPHLERHATRQTWLAHSQTGNWEAVRERFAKVFYLATRDNTAVGAVPSLPALPAGAVGDVIEPTTSAAAAASAVTSALLAKIECKYVKQAAGAEVINAGSLDNVVVVRNNLTMEDISMTVAQVNALAGVQAVTTALFVVSAVNHFNYGNFVDGSDNPCVNAKLQLNGHDRFQARDGSYFNYVQPSQHWTNTPADGVNVYSFALKAEDHQPTGTCNFSRIDNATLQVDVGKYNASDSAYVSTYVGTNSNTVLNIYTQNYNVLRVMSGMAGTAYSN